ncbi:hypothetical protein ACFPK5_00885 [Streptomyces beijiangensis]|uniref:hypothetical protein n=1 Tax=Streptomyces beijiangensis TaxID=163361 RepID=UPI0031D48055
MNSLERAEAYRGYTDREEIELGNGHHIMIGTNVWDPRNPHDQLHCSRCTTTIEGTRAGLRQWVAFHAQECDGTHKSYRGRSPQEEVALRERTRRMAETARKIKAERAQQAQQSAPARAGSPGTGTVTGAAATTAPSRKTAAKKAQPKAPSGHANCAACKGTGVQPVHNADGTWAGSKPCDGRVRTSVPPARKTAARATAAKSASVAPPAAPAPAARKNAAARPQSRFAKELQDSQNKLAADIAAHRTAPAVPRKKAAPAPRKAAARPAAARAKTAVAKPTAPQRKEPPARAAEKKPEPRKKAAKKEKKPVKSASAAKAGTSRAKKFSRTVAYARKHPFTASLAAFLVVTTVAWRMTKGGGRLLKRGVTTAWARGEDDRLNRRAAKNAAEATAAGHKGCPACKGTGVLPKHNPDGTWAGSVRCTKSAARRSAARRSA